MTEPNWKIADRFDCKLFALMDGAINHSGSRRNQVEKQWAEVAYHLRQARKFVRDMMREQDRANTQ